ncbi:MAG: two pore domain potassium channel family protein [Phycisphaerales bacterium]|nr:two pore domain potassium channel family protein [Phycisphaerales bacterium]
MNSGSPLPSQKPHASHANRRTYYEQAINPRRWLRNRCLPMFITLVAMLSFFPYLVNTDTHVRLFGFALFALLPAVGVISLGGKYGIFFSVVALGIFTVGSFVTEHRDMTTALIGWHGIFVMVYYSYCTIIIAHAVFRKEAIQPDRIYGGISVYLLIGFVFGVIHHRINEVTPGSYQLTTPGVVASNCLMWHDFLYFSFSTLTTSGFGDIIAASPRARSTTIMEAVIGVLYPAILIAKLVNWPVPTSQENSK